MTLSEMRTVLADRGIQLTKSLGQNFLHDGNQLDRIVRLADIRSGEPVLEIGPGLGPLTERLLAAGARVHAVELDDRLVPILRSRFEAHPHFQLTHGDGLAFVRDADIEWSEWKLVSNLPYSVGSPILVELALKDRPPKDLVATLQWEVVQRLAAAPSTKDYGVLTLLVAQAYASAGQFKIPPGCFFPPPNIDSGCIHLRRREPPLFRGSDRQRFAKLVKHAFSQRRKIMSKLLKAAWPAERVDAAMRACGLAPTARAEELGLDQFVRLAEHLSHE